jgi:hypothetical protein
MNVPATLQQANEFAEDKGFGEFWKLGSEQDDFWGFVHF